jgi:hypothetical protein
MPATWPLASLGPHLARACFNLTAPTSVGVTAQALR